MEKIKTLVEVRELIFSLEIKQAKEKQLLKEEFKLTIEKLRPANLIKNTISDLVKAPDFKGNLLDAALSIATGYISKKVLVGATLNPLKQLFGTLLQVGVTSIVSKNTDGIKSTAMNLIKNIFSKRRAIS